MASPLVVGPSNASTTVVPSCAAVNTAYTVGDVVLTGDGSGTSYSWEGTVFASLACTKRTRVSVSATLTRSSELTVGGPLTLYAVANFPGTNAQYSSSSNSCDAQYFIVPKAGAESYTLSTVFAFDVPDGTTLLDICVTAGYTSTGTGTISVSSLSVDALTGLGVPASAHVAVPHTWNVALATVQPIGPASGTYAVIASMGGDGKVSGTPVKDVGCNVYWQLGASPAASDPVVASAVANAGSDGTFTYNMSAANASPFIAPWLSNSYYATLSSPSVVPITSATVAPAQPTFATFDTVPVRGAGGTATISFLTTAAVTGVVSIYFTIYELLPTGSLAVNPTGGAAYFMNGANSRVTWLVPPTVGCAYSTTATYVVLVTRRDTGATAAALPFTLP